MADEVEFDLKRGLNAWVEQNTSLTEFAEALGYRYQNAWGLVRGKVPVTVETIGRFALAYRCKKLDEMLALAGLTDDQIVRFTNGQPVIDRRVPADETGKQVDEDDIPTYGPNEETA